MLGVFLAGSVCAQPSGGVFFSEVFYHPPQRHRATSAKREEWLELTNGSALAKDLGGYTLRGGIRFCFPSGTTIGSGRCLVVASTPDVFGESHHRFAGQVVGPYDGHLSNAGERVELVGRDGKTIDLVEYDDVSPWPIAADGLGGSLVRRDASLRGDSPRAWEASELLGGSPGIATSARGASINGGSTRLPIPPPGLMSVDVEGELESHGYLPHSPLRIRAAIESSDPAARVVLHSQVVRPGEYVRSSEAATRPWRLQAMLRTSGGCYEVTIRGEPSRTLLRWRVEVSDAGGADSYPRRGDPVLHRAAFFFAGEPAVRGTGAVGSTPRRSPSIPTYFLIAQIDDARRVLTGGRFRARGPREIESTLVFEGRAFDGVRVRRRGRSAGAPGRVASLKVRLPKGDVLVSERQPSPLHRRERRRLNLNAAERYFGLHEHLAYALFRAAGATAPETEFAHLRIIRSKDEHDPLDGLRLDVEEIDTSFFRARGMDVEALYKMQGIPAARKIRGTPQPHASRLIGALRGRPSADWIETNLDLARYLAFRSAVRIADVRDLGRANYYLLLGGERRRWELIPHDLNDAFGLKTVDGHDLFSSAVREHYGARLDQKVKELLRARPPREWARWLETEAIRIEPLVAMRPSRSRGGAAADARAMLSDAVRTLIRKLEHSWQEAGLEPGLAMSKPSTSSDTAVAPLKEPESEGK